ncbi:MAG: clostripain-related cysteine peptidase [bacterium]
MNILRTIITMAYFIALNFFTQQYSNASSYITEKIKASCPTLKNRMEKIDKKDWTFLVYMAANSNLSKDSVRALKQMLNVGSTNTINIVVQIDKQGESDIERMYIQKNKAFLLEVNPQINEPEVGTSQSLYNFIKWGITNFPSTKLALLFWNNGSGIKDIDLLDKVLTTHRDQIYTINLQNGLSEINYEFSNNFNLMKKIEKNYAKLFELDTKKTAPDGSDSAKNRFHIYLTNQDLKNILDQTQQELLNNKKIDLVFMDACHMAMAEIASQIKNSTKFLVASQEIEPAAGYNYELLLSPFLDDTLSADDFAKNSVVAFENEYSSKYAQYTQSAINLKQIDKIEQDIKNLSTILLQLIKINPDMTIGALKGIRNNNRFTTEFYDADYIDLCYFYKSLIFMVDTLKKPKRGFAPTEDYTKNLDDVKVLAQGAIDSMKNIIIKTTSSKFLTGANGISIYFPKRKVHESYYKTSFDQETQWSLFLNVYIPESKKINNSQIELDLEKRGAEIERKAAELEKRALTKSIQITNKKNKKTVAKKNTHSIVKKNTQESTKKNQAAKKSEQKTTISQNTNVLDKNVIRCNCSIKPVSQQTTPKTKPQTKPTSKSKPNKPKENPISKIQPNTPAKKNITTAANKTTANPTVKNTKPTDKSFKK